MEFFIKIDKKELTILPSQFLRGTKALAWVVTVLMFLFSFSFAQVKSQFNHSIIKKGGILRIPPEKLLLEKHTPITFNQFDRSYFHIPPTQNFIRLRNGKTLPVDEFLKEVNDLEEKLNKYGYTLRDSTPIKIKYIYPREQFKLQKEMFSKYFLKNDSMTLPPQIVCEGYSEGTTKESGRPKDFVPLDWEKKWEYSFGNKEDFGVRLAASLKIKGQENSLNVEPLFNSDISFLGDEENILKIYRKGNTLIGESQGKAFFRQPLSGTINQTYKSDLNWNGNIDISLFDLFKITGTLGFTGYSELYINGKFSSSSAEENLRFKVFARAFGNVETSILIASANVDADLLIIDYEPEIAASAKLTSSSPRNFDLSAYGKVDKGNLLEGKLIIHGEIDYLIGSKKFEVELYGDSGYSLVQPDFSYKFSVPAEKDHDIWLKIKKISGITPYTARNEKLEVEPQEFEVVVDIGGRSYTKILKDYNKDGIYGTALGEYEPLEFKIPLLSYQKVPISIEVIEKYKTGSLDFKNTLDFAPGVWKKVELCYDPGKRTFSGTKSGGENEEIRCVGDSSYWGERNHTITFEIGGLKLKGGPEKAK